MASSEEGPPLERREQTARSVEAFETLTAAVPPVGPRVRWGGVTSGFIIALGTILLLTALGLAIGITAVGDPRAATHNTVTGLGIGAGIWAALTLLIAYFLGGLVSTTVTDRPDRAGALIHGALVWTLASVFLLWLLGQGISLGLSGLFGALGGLTRTVATVATGAVAGGGDLAQRLGFTDPSRVMDRLEDPQTVSVFAAATGISTEEARTALAQFRDRVAAVRENPDQVAAEARTFLAQYADRAQQQALKAAAAVQEGATVSSWVTFGVLVLTLVVAMLGALAGIPSLRTWRMRWTRTCSWNSPVSSIAGERGRPRLIGSTAAMRPGRAAMTTTRSDRITASVIEWVTKTTVVPVRCHSSSSR